MACLIMTPPERLARQRGAPWTAEASGAGRDRWPRACGATRRARRARGASESTAALLPLFSSGSPAAGLPPRSFPVRARSQTSAPVKKFRVNPGQSGPIRVHHHFPHRENSEKVVIRTRPPIFAAAAAAATLLLLATLPAPAHPVLAEPPDYPFVAGFDRFYAPEDDEPKITEGGLLLLSELNCVACHAAPDAWKDRLPQRGKIALDGVGSRLS